MMMQCHIGNYGAMLPKDVNLTSMQGHFGKNMVILPKNYIAKLSDDIMHCHIGNPMAMLPNDVNLTSIQGHFCKYMATLPKKYLTI